MNKRIKTIFVLGFIAAIFIFLVIRSSKEEKVKIKIPIPKPNISSQYKGSLEFVFELNEKNLQIPPEIPVLKEINSEEITKNQAIDIAKNFGITSEVFEIEDIYDGTTYIWETTSEVLYVRSKTNKIEYQSYIDPNFVVNKKLSENVIISQAKKFLTDNKLLTYGVSDSPSIKYLKGNSARGGLSPSSKNEATFYQVNFSPNFLDYEIISTDPDKTLVSVVVLPDGEIYKSTVINKDFNESENKYVIKSLEEIKSSISKAILISLDNNNINLSDLNKTDVQKITINEIIVAYYFDPSSSQIHQPIFLLKGLAKLVGSNTNIEASLYLPALK